MLIWNPSKLTTKGKALLAKAQAGRCTIKITKAQTGSGQYSSGEATDTRTSLKAPVQTLPIHSKEIQNGSTLVLKVAITNKTSDTDVLKSGYEIREFGIFAQDPDDGEILYSIATASTSDYMPAYNGVIPSVISMSYYLEVANASSVTIVTAGGLALQSDLEALADRVTIIEQAAVKKYGARKKVGQQSCGAESWERLGGAVGLTAKAAVGTGDCGNGKEVEASINEKGTATGGKPGDQTGKEFLIRSYRNYPWTNVLRYAAESKVSGSGKKDVTTVAREVLAGAWGNGDDRKNRLTAAGYDYTAVQAEVNRLASGASTPKKSTTEIAKEVLAGKWGNGDDRKKKLQAAGYDYAAVQAEVNRLAKGGSSTKKSVTAVAKEVLAGKWGNGDARKKKLQAAGYNYNAVQKEVNRLMR